MGKRGTTHTCDTENPQSYWQHGKVAFFGSLKLIWYGLAGIIHAVFPEIKSLQFHTSSGIIRSYRALERSQRHDPEIAKIFSQERLEYVQKNRGK